MDTRSKLLNKHFEKSTIAGTISINDLSEKEFNGEALTEKEKLALTNFAHYRISELNIITDDRAFHKRYQELQVIANLGDYTEFLNEKYTI